MEIRRTYSGPHPAWRNRPGPYSNSGKPTECYAQVLAVVAGDVVAISMNGTAVLTLAELRRLVRDIEGVAA